MKPLATVFAVLVLCCAVQATETFIWTGATDSDWEDFNNWTQSPGSNSFPGGGAGPRTDDVAYINAGVTQPEFDAASGTRTVETITIDADTNSTTVSLTVSGGSLTTNGLVLVKGEQTGTDTATITVSGGTFAPAAMCFWGRYDPNNPNDGHAIGSFSANMTVQNPCDNSWDTWVRGYVDWTIGSSVTINMKDLELDGLNGADLMVNGGGATSALSTCSFRSNGQAMSVEGVAWTNS